MLRIYEPVGNCLKPRDDRNLTGDVLWIDLIEPTPEEDVSLEKALGISIPTRAEAREIEASSRLYRENGAIYMTAFVLYNIDAQVPDSATVTFVLSGNKLVSIRYHEPKAFPIYCSRAGKGEVPCESAPLVLIGILDTIIERAADLIERTQDEVERIAKGIFGNRLRGGPAYARHLDAMLEGLGRQGDITARMKESAFSLERLVAYFQVALRDRNEAPATMGRLHTLQQDVHSLSEQMRFLMDRVMFLLDATLGHISIEQNNTMKVFSLLAVTLMPPTLLGSIYGMNFKHMPELDWIWGYPMALVLMVLSGVLPYLMFRWKGWI